MWKLYWSQAFVPYHSYLPDMCITNVRGISTIKTSLTPTYNHYTGSTSTVHCEFSEPACYTSPKSLSSHGHDALLFTVVSSNGRESSVDRFTESVLGLLCMVEML